jgi:UDP-N-acetylmuramoyl-L-alanyl-D-glutamate--2,6-diaminopimelate ligase
MFALKLTKLIKNVEVIEIIGNINHLTINAIYDHSEKVSAKGLFVCVVGLRVDAHNFAKKAEENGAVALVVEKKLESSLPQIVVKNTKIALSKLAGNFYKKVLDKLKIIGVVGTNGKTTTTYFIKQLLTSLHVPVGVIGTSGIFINQTKLPATLTTPDTLDLFLLFESMQKAGVEVVVMEVSAHAIFLHKVDGFLSEVAVFTNFSEDHLDFFKTKERYQQTKASYFNKNFCKKAVINLDDEMGKKLMHNASIPSFSYSMANKKANLHVTNLQLNEWQSKFTLNYNNNSQNIVLNVGAKYNVFNLLAAVGALFCMGYSFETLFKAVKDIKALSGRFKRIIVDKNCSVIIDFAHTPEALKQLLTHVNNMQAKHIISVLGCPGSRDQFKRSVMARLAGKRSSFVILTTDNPDIENPLFILKQMERGVKKTKCPYYIVEDRKKAVKTAFDLKKADEKTIIVLIGKGEEAYQIINGILVPYNDEEEVLKQIKRKQP